MAVDLGFHRSQAAVVVAGEGLDAQRYDRPGFWFDERTCDGWSLPKVGVPPVAYDHFIDEG
jgi:hypothetical protein